MVLCFENLLSHPGNLHTSPLRAEVLVQRGAASVWDVRRCQHKLNKLTMSQSVLSGSSWRYECEGSLVISACYLW